MAVEKVIKLVTELDDKGIKELDKDIKQAEESSKDLEKQNKKTSKSFKRVGQAVKVVGTALKAAGIGLVIALFAKLGDVVSKNQKVLDVFSNVSTSLSIAFNDLFSIFENGLPSISELGTAIKNNLIERFKSLIEFYGLVGKGLKQLFSGDFAGAAETAKKAGKELVDVATGIDNAADKIANYTKETYAAAEATTALANASKLAEAQNRRLFEQYDRDAEIQRRIRDDFEKTADQRLAANDKLKEILNEQEKAQLRLGRIVVASARAEIAATGENVENKVALINALSELDAIEADIAGRRAEQEAQDRALRKELLEERKAEIGDVLSLEGEPIEVQRARITANAIDEIDLEATAKAAEQAEARKLIAEYEAEGKREALMGYAGALSQISGILGQETAAGKAIAISSSLINTYASITGQLKAFAGVPVPGYAIAQAIATGAVGFANVAKIASVKVPNSSGGATPRGSAVGGSGGGAAAAPSFNVVGTSGVNQLAESLQQDQQPVQAYVVSSNVTTQQELDRNIVDTVSLG